MRIRYPTIERKPSADGSNLVGSIVADTVAAALAGPRPEGARTLNVEVELSPELAEALNSKRDLAFSVDVP
jgi:hypothetical protein